MSKIKKVLAIMLTLILSMSMIPTINVSAAKKVKLNKTKATIYVGKTVTLKLKNNKKKVKWSSSNKKVVTVSKKGKVKGKKAGKAIITAKVGKKKYKCKIIVKKKATNDRNISYNNGKTEVNTIANNYEKLKLFILQNGTALNSTDYIYYFYRTNSENYFSMKYYSNKQLISFNKSYDKSEGCYLGSITLDVNNLSNSRAIITRTDMKACYMAAYANLDVCTFNNTQMLPFSTSICSIFDSSITLEKDATKITNLILLEANMFLENTGIGFGMQNLGFEKYIF